jgi:hypothetical protein
MANPVVSAAETGTSNSNLYVNIAGQGTGTLAGDNVDPKLGKADRLLSFSEQMVREVNTAAENNLFSAGEIDASWVYIEILRTQASIYAQNSFLQGNNITPINVYRVDTINGKYTVTEEIDYTNCIITKIEANAVSLEGRKLDTIKLWFRFTARTDTLYFFDQTGQPQGQNVSTVDFTNGTLQAAAPAAAAAPAGGEAPAAPAGGGEAPAGGGEAAPAA